MASCVDRKSRKAVNCGTCGACCRIGPVVLLPEDNPADYRSVRIDGVWRVQTKPNGECTHLTADGCEVWENAPAVCRRFDCHEYVILQGFDYGEEIGQAARRIEAGLSGGDP